MSKPNLFRKFAKELEKANLENGTFNFFDTSAQYYYSIYRLMDAVGNLMKESQLRVSHYFIKFWSKAIALFAMSIYFRAVNEEHELDNKNKKVVQGSRTRKTQEKEKKGKA